VHADVAALHLVHGCLTVGVAAERTEEVDFGPKPCENRGGYDAAATCMRERTSSVGHGATRGELRHLDKVNPFNVPYDRDPGHSGGGYPQEGRACCSGDSDHQLALLP
jgi:hypothetical protein